MADTEEAKAEAVVTVPAQKHEEAERSSPGVIVLQWLTYVFWGWTVIALLFLAYIVFSTFMTDRSYGDGPLYAIAATLVLLPLSIVCDVFYVRREPLKKVGASMVVMVIHAVIFAVLGIGALIAAVFTLIQLYISGDGDTTSIMVWLWSFLVAAVVYAVLFVRALNPFHSRTVAKYIPVVMAVVVGLFVVLGFAGPLAAEREARDDRRIEAHLNGVRTGVYEYIDEHEELPSSLDVVTIDNPEAKRLVDDGLVKYVKDKSVSGESEGVTELRYQLCVTYVRAHNADYYDMEQYSRGNEYSEFLDNYSHPKGDVCYKLMGEVREPEVDNDTAAGARPVFNKMLMTQ